MRPAIKYTAGLALLAGVAAGGNWLAARAGLPLPGPVLGMLGYGAVLLTTPWLDWSLGAARWVAGLIGALLVPPLVGVVLYQADAAAGGLRLAAVLVVGTGLTALATAWLFRLCGGRA